MGVPPPPGEFANNWNKELFRSWYELEQKYLITSILEKVTKHNLVPRVLSWLDPGNEVDENKNKVVRSLSRKISDLRSQKKKMREGFKFFFSSSGFCPDRCSKTDELKLHHWKHFSPHVTESKAVLDFGFNAVDFGFQELDSGIFVSGTWILACVQTPPIWIQDSNR